MKGHMFLSTQAVSAREGRKWRRVGPTDRCDCDRVVALMDTSALETMRPPPPPPHPGECPGCRAMLDANNALENS